MTAPNPHQRKPLVYTPEVLAEINTLHNQKGISIEEISRQLDGEAQTIRRRMWAAGYAVKTYLRPKIDYTPELLAQANQLHNVQRLSLHQIAPQLGCDRKVLRAKMIGEGYEVRSQKDSQRARRDLELQLGKADVMDWGAHELFRNGK